MFFKKEKEIFYPEDRGVYAFTKYRRGDFLIFLKESSPLVFEFMQLPDRYVLHLTAEEYTKGVNGKILDFVEQLPEDVFDVACDNKIILEKS